MQLFELLLGDRRGSMHQQVQAALVLGEGQHVADRLAIGQQAVELRTVGREVGRAHRHDVDVAGIRYTLHVLHDVFRYSFPEIAEITGRTPAACRQLASSARGRIRAAQPPPSPPARQAG